MLKMVQCIHILFIYYYAYSTLIIFFVFFAVCKFLSNINIGLEKNDVLFTLQCLQKFGIKISEEYKANCYKTLYNTRNMKV